MPHCWNLLVLNNLMSNIWPALFLFLAGAVALVVPSGYSIGFYGLSFGGLVIWLLVRNRLLTSDAYAFVMPVLVYATGQLAQNLHEQLSWRSVDPFVPFLLLVFGVWFLRRYKPSAQWFWTGLAVGAVGAACFAGYQALVFGGRAGGYLHPIMFGNIALLLGVLCMVRALITLEMTWVKALMWLGFVCGIMASVWSQTRGGWIAIVLIFFWILAHATRHWSWLRKLVAVTALAGAMGVLGVELGMTQVVQSRVSVAIAETTAFFDKNQQESSVGSRLAMWRFAIRHIGDAPWAGVGKQGWLALRDKGVANGDLSATYISSLDHVHNEYLDAALKHGLIGFCFLLLLYLIPMLKFFRPHLNALNAEVKALAMAGMVIPMMYMDFGLTQVFLSHNSGRMVLVSLWMCVAALLLNATEEANEAASKAVHTNV
jgi:O-antigen ligase